MHDNLARYLIFFQYVGTKYSGVVKVPPRQLHKKGVQDHLEAAILRLRPVNPVRLSVSSRTDTGVHALCNSAHFDLQRKDDRDPFTDEVLTEALNFHLRDQHIRLNRAVRVPLHFHARYKAQSRTYLYRVALGGSKFQFPLSESDFCWNLCRTELDVESMHKAAAMLVGTHDFSSFRAVNSDLPFKDPVKTMDQISIQPGASFTSNRFHKDIAFWELTFRSRSFLYRQVRRMTGALMAVGTGRLSPLGLKEVLDARDSLAFPQGLSAPAHGLFLANVEYKESDLQTQTSPCDPSFCKNSSNPPSA